MSARHRLQTASTGIHVVQSIEFADAAARNAFVATAADIGRYALQQDTGEFYLLENDAPLTWGGAGAAALTNAAPEETTVEPAAVGSASLAARADHKHSIETDTAVELTDTSNAEGSSTSVARADHTHGHGDRAGGTLHADAVASGASGFISGSDQAKLDGVAAGATNNTLTAAAPEDVTKSVAAVGVSTEVARADHKHDVTTAAAVELTDSANAEGSATSLARSDHTHAHGDRAGGTLHADAVASGASGFISGSDQAKLDGIEAGADVTDIANVSTALGGAAGANVGFVFKSDGAGSGTMQIGTTFIEQTLTVGLPGSTTDHTSVEAAVTAAVSGGASVADPWIVVVYPGEYTEAAFTVPPGVMLTTPNGERGITTRLVASNPLVDFITCTGGVISGLHISGVTGAAVACVRVNNPFAATSFYNITIGTCSNGIIVESGTTFVIEGILFTVLSASASIGTGITVRNTGTVCVVRGLLANVPSAVLPAYPGSNPLERVLDVSDAARVQVSQLSCEIAFNTATQRVAVVDSGGELLIQGGLFVECSTVCTVGSVGASLLKLLGCDFTLNAVNIESLSSSATIEAQISVDSLKLSLVAGTALSGTILDESNQSTSVYALHTVYTQPSSFEDMDVSEYLAATSSSCAYSGGLLTDGGGLNVDVTAGSGLVRIGGGAAVRSVTWTSTTVAVPASSTRFIHYQESTNTIVATAGSPGATDILLGSVVSGSASIRYIHLTGTHSEDAKNALSVYLYDTRRATVVSGLVAEIGTGATKFTVNAGTYYLGFRRITLSADVDATFSAYYDTDGATEVAAQTDVDIVNYDNAGTLTAMTAGFFRSDTLYRTSDGNLALIYGVAEFSTQVAAEAEDPATTISIIEASGFPVASLVVEQGVGIAIFVDRRPFANSAATGGGGAGATVHGSLTGLGADDHTIYLLGDGTRAMSGSLDMGANSITNVNLVDGVDVTTHASRHNPGGGDALATAAAAAAQVGASSTEGAAASLARSDHTHAVARGTPVNVGTANAAGSATDFAGSDHVHAHGVQAGGTLHADAIASGASGFISGADQAKLDGVAASATNTPLTAAAPEDTTKAAAVVGVATDAARADHKHDVTTAAAVELTDSTNAEGAATSLARSDHTHGHGDRAGGTLHADAVASGASGFISGGDQAKLDGIAASATNTPLTAAAPEDTTKAAAVVGVATDAARADHKHDVTTAAPVAVGAANAEGAATTLARSNHVHAPKSGSVIQHAYADESADITTASTTYVTLFSVNITVSANSRLNIFANAAGTTGANNTEVSLRASVDGTPIRAATDFWRTTDDGNTTLIVQSGVLAAGVRTVLIEWKVNGSNASINVATSPNEHSATTLIQEVAG